MCLGKVSFTLLRVNGMRCDVKMQSVLQMGLQATVNLLLLVLFEASYHSCRFACLRSLPAGMCAHAILMFNVERWLPNEGIKKESKSE